MRPRLPHVSEILNLLAPHEHGSMPEESLSVKAREGTMVHRMCHLVATRENGVDWSRVPESPMKDKARSFEKFLRDTEAKILWSEKRFQAPQYCGTPDILAEIRGLPVVIDLKPSLQLRYRVQVSVYGRMVFALDPQVGSNPDVMLLVLFPTRYKCEYVLPQEQDRHCSGFDGALQVLLWKQRFQRGAK